MQHRQSARQTVASAPTDAHPLLQLMYCAADNAPAATTAAAGSGLPSSLAQHCYSVRRIMLMCNLSMVLWLCLCCLFLPPFLCCNLQLPLVVFAVM